MTFSFSHAQSAFRRAGLEPSSPLLEELLALLFASPAVSVHGFYCHAGQSYGSTSMTAASKFLSTEIDAVNTAAGLALNLLATLPKNVVRTSPFILAVGSTPTAHAANAETRDKLASLLNGSLELHAGMLKDDCQSSSSLISNM